MVHHNAILAYGLALGLVFLASVCCTGCDKRSQQEINKAVEKAKEEAARKAKDAAQKAVDDAVEEVKDAAKKKLDEVTRPSDQPSPDEIEAAVNWALSLEHRVYKPFLREDGKVRLDDRSWVPRDERNFYGLCQAFVGNAYLQKFQSAPSAADVARLLGAKDDGSAPAPGTWAFYTMASNPDGHVALSIGEGKVVSVSTNASTGIAKVKVEDYRNVAGTSGYIGWAWPKRKATPQ